MKTICIPPFNLEVGTYLNAWNDFWLRRKQVKTVFILFCAIKLSSLSKHVSFHDEIKRLIDEG